MLALTRQYQNSNNNTIFPNHYLYTTIASLYLEIWFVLILVMVATSNHRNAFAILYRIIRFFLFYIFSFSSSFFQQSKGWVLRALAYRNRYFHYIYVQLLVYKLYNGIYYIIYRITSVSLSFASNRGIILYCIIIIHDCIFLVRLFRRRSILCSNNKMHKNTSGMYKYIRVDRRWFILPRL